MTLDDIDTKHPNGLVDAQITAITVDYQNRVVNCEFGIPICLALPTAGMRTTIDMDYLAGYLTCSR